MNGQVIVEQTLVDILRTVAMSSLPLYEYKLEQLALNEYPQNMDIVRNVVFPQLRRILDLVEVPSDIFRELRDMYSTTWFQEVVHPLLILDVDMVLDNIYDTFKKIDDGITLLQQKQSRSDLIGDVFTVVKRDIYGGALELQHRIPEPHVGMDVPIRRYYNCSYRFATHLEVMAAMEHKFNLGEDQQLPPWVCARLKYIIGYNFLDDDTINNWIEGLIQVYTEVARKYSLSAQNLFDYMREKEERNENSHFDDRIKELILLQLSFHQFIQDHTELQNTFTDDELDLLDRTFRRCGDYLQSSPKLSTDLKITVGQTNNPASNFNANFVQETDTVNLCKVAEVGLFNSNGQQRRMPAYWNPRIIDTNTHVILPGYRVPN